MAPSQRFQAVAGVALMGMVCNAGAADAVPAASSIYYQCPGNVFTNTIGAKEAESRHCTAKEAKEPTTIAGPSRSRAATTAGGATATASGAPGSRIDPASQRSRDSDARRILGDELRTEEERLGGLQKDFNHGEPERQGSERNFQKYADRVVEMRAAIARKESDIVAIKRELAKLPP